MSYRGGGADRVGLVVFVAVLLAAIPAAAGEPRDPVAVFYSTGSCSRGVFEVERWDRAQREWKPHPDHPRIFTDSCQIEDAGALLNETRVRCLSPEPLHEEEGWRVGVRVWDPKVMERCAAPRDPNQSKPFVVRLVTPQSGDVVRNLDRSVEMLGWVELATVPVAGYDIMLVLDDAPEVRGTIGRAARALLEALEERPESIRVGVVRFSSVAPGVGSGPGANLEHALDADLTSVARVLERVSSAPFAGVDGAAQALDLAVETLEARGGSGAEGSEFRQPVLVVVADGDAARPFGSEVAMDPAFRRRLLDGVRAAQEQSIELHTIGIAPAVHEAPEVARNMKLAARGSLRWYAGKGASEASDRLLVEQLLPSVVRMEVSNSATGVRATDVQLEAFGRFRVTVPLDEGHNRLDLLAELSNGRLAVGSVELSFDSTGPRADWMKKERERIEGELRQRKQVIVEPDS